MDFKRGRGKNSEEITKGCIYRVAFDIGLKMWVGI